jgi:hypothetical protein
MSQSDPSLRYLQFMTKPFYLNQHRYTCSPVVNMLLNLSLDKTSRAVT